MSVKSGFINVGIIFHGNQGILYQIIAGITSRFPLKTFDKNCELRFWHLMKIYP